MAQVKKLQNGGTPNNILNKKMYNGVELTDNDINNIISSVGNWGASNSNYTEDTRKWGELGTKVKDYMINGLMPNFKTTGTGMTIGDLDVEEGQTNQNVFGNWGGNKLSTQYTSKLKEALDKFTTEKTNSTNKVTTPTTKIYTNPKNIIAKNDFGENYDSFENNWNTYDLATRKNKLRNALTQSINDYGDSDLKSRLPELNNPNLDDKTLLEIGNKTGYDYSELLNGSSSSSNQNSQSNKYDSLKQFGNKIEDDYLKSKGLVAFKNNEGVTKIFNDSDLSEYSGEGGIESNFGKYYSYGMFKDPNKGWYWGNKQSFSGTPVYGISEKSYANVRNQIQQNLQSKYNSVDFNNERSNIFGTSYFNQYKDNNKFEFLDVSGNFTGISKNIAANRLIVPKKTATYDDLGAIDLQKSPAILIIDGKQTPVTIKLNSEGESVAIDNSGKEHSLGAYGDTQMNQMTPWESFKSSIDLGIETPKMTQPQLQIGINSVQGFNNTTPINSQNFNYFVSQVLKKNFKNNLTPQESNHLANTLAYYYNTVGKGKYNDMDLKKIQEIIKELNSNTEIKTKAVNKNTSNISSNNPNINYAFYRKNGGIIKAQAGASLSALTAQKAKPKQQTKLQISQKESHSARLRDTNDWDTSDTLDAVGTGLDALSLAGGAVGVGAGLASTLVQAVSDSNRSGFLSGEMVKNLGINLGFTALAFIPGASALKVGKIAKTANKLSQASKFIKDTEKAVKILSKTGELTQDTKKALKAIDTAKKVISDVEKGKDITKFINKVTLNPITKTAATAARTGFATLGISNGVNSANDIIQDVNSGGVGAIQVNDLRGLVGGVAGTRAAIGIGKNSLIRKGTEPIKSFEKKTTELKEDASKWSKTKTKVSDFKENTLKKSGDYTKNKLTDTWKDRKLKSEKDANWITRQGIKQAKKAGFTENGLGINEDYKHLSTVLNNARFKESVGNYIKTRPRKMLALPEWKNPTPVSGKYPVAEEPHNPVKAFQESINNLLKVNNSSRLSKMSGQSRKATLPKQLSLEFKDGGLLVRKFQNSGEIISGEVISGEKINNKREKIDPLPLKRVGLNIDPIKIKLPTIPTDFKYNINLDPLKKRTIDFDTTLLRELPKLTSSLVTNERNRQLMSSVNPALLQNPTEIYKPVVTNLANETAVKNQVSDFIRRASVPMTSDATLHKAGLLETISKSNPLITQAKAENTNMYNQTLANSRDNSEKYALQRNEVANQNRQMIVADQAAKARYAAGKLVADNASFSNYFDKANQVFERNQMYKKSYEQSKSLMDLQNELDSKLKPFKSSYDAINNDYTKSNTFNKFNLLKKQNVDLDWNSTNGTGDQNKSWKQLYDDEIKGLNDSYTNEYNRILPSFNDRRLKLSNANPYTSQFSFKSGGELTALSRVEVQKLRNKLKEKELDAKYVDKALDRKQKEVTSILNGLSKETFFLLKTILGK